MGFLICTKKCLVPATKKTEFPPEYISSEVTRERRNSSLGSSKPKTELTRVEVLRLTNWQLSPANWQKCRGISTELHTRLAFNGLPGAPCW